MRKYYLSHIDFSEIINITSDEAQITLARERMQKLGMLTENGNPAISSITTTANSTKAFFGKMERKLRHRTGGIHGVRDTLQKLCDRKDYYGFFLYIAFLYGFLEWQVPERVVLLPAVPEALKYYCNALMEAFDRYLRTDSKEAGENGNPSDI